MMEHAMKYPVSQFLRGATPVQPTEVVALGIARELILKIAELQEAANSAQHRLPVSSGKGGTQ
ncbi:hypothetical protein [Agrobacterium sp. CCNWLW71]|uniref:hypothetical protein n=2 Tax=unclassified Agrobacterium TaxID=2632611 RepID=UPI00300FA185